MPGQALKRGSALPAPVGGPEGIELPVRRRVAIPAIVDAYSASPMRAEPTERLGFGRGLWVSHQKTIGQRSANAKSRNLVGIHLMNRSQIEHWAITTIEAVKALGAKFEDSRVELKADWPDPVKGARRIAGLANAARGEPILVLIGVDDVRHNVVAITATDPATWFAQVASAFDGPPPDPVDLILLYEGVAIHALYFETTRPPYLVKNPLFGSSPGNIQFEVPWREGTAVRTATRIDLLKILVPSLLLPDVEDLGTSLAINTTETPRDGKCNAWFESRVYLIPKTRDRLVLPFHHCQLMISGESLEVLGDLTGFQLRPQLQQDRADRGMMMLTGFEPSASPIVHNSPTEVVFDGPGEVSVRQGIKVLPRIVESDVIHCRFELSIAGLDRPVAHSVMLRRSSGQESIGGTRDAQWHSKKS